MALRFECSLLFAQKVIDTADIVRDAIFRQLPTPTLIITPDPVTHFTDNISVIGITLFESVRYANASGPPTEAKGK